MIDHESLAKAATAAGKLLVADACYRVLIFPAMKAVRFSMIEKARDFAATGGLVIAIGCLPDASDRMGRGDAVLNGLLVEIFGSADGTKDQFKQHSGGGAAAFLRSGYSSVLETINEMIEREVVSSMPLQVLHRRLEDRDLYFVFNPSDDAIAADLALRHNGGVDHWNAWSGQIRSLSHSNGLTLDLAPREACILVSNRDATSPVLAAGGASSARRTEILDGAWQSLIHPLLDNRFGDFSLPASQCLVGPQARRFRYRDGFGDEDDWQGVGFDDAAWLETTFSFGPQLEVAGPFPPDTNFMELEETLLKRNEALAWRPYAFSRRWGIERDPFLTDWLSGPHGLKGVVPDEFLDFHSDTVGSAWYLRAAVVAHYDGEHTLITGARCGYQVWLNGEATVVQQDGLGPGRFAPWKIQHYECEAVETQVKLRQGSNDLLVKLVQPVGQRTRAFFAFDPQPAALECLALRWFTAEDSLRPCIFARTERRSIRFRFMSPPGLREITFTSRGLARVWVGGVEIVATVIGAQAGGCIRYRAWVGSNEPEPQCVAIRVEAPADSHAGDALPESVAFTCGAGLIQTGDWCAQGLATYSGAVEYRRSLCLPEIPPGRFLHLDLGKVSATAEVRMNGQPVATLVTPPWRCDLTAILRPGENTLSITVANTLANHYSVGIPTPYAFASQSPSGLFGPVTLITTS